MTEPDAVTEPDGARPPGHRLRPRKAQRGRVSVIGVFGEVLITAGVLVLLFLGWQGLVEQCGAGEPADGRRVEAGSAVVGAQQVASRADRHGHPGATAAPAPPVMAPVAAAQPLGVMYVPRFGDGWKRIIRETVDVQSVLNSYDAGVGHYPNTQMPGAVGNFAVAAHDTGYGNAFLNVSKLQLGDKIYIQTKDGFYTYEFRNFEYIQPTTVNVLLPVPQVAGATASNRLITLTTCNPPYHAQERIAAFGTFDSFSATPPSEIAAEVSGG